MCFTKGPTTVRRHLNASAVSYHSVPLFKKKNTRQYRTYSAMAGNERVESQMEVVGWGVGVEKGSLGNSTHSVATKPYHIRVRGLQRREQSLSISRPDQVPPTGTHPEIRLLELGRCYPTKGPLTRSQSGAGQNGGHQPPPATPPSWPGNMSVTDFSVTTD